MTDLPVTRIARADMRVAPWQWPFAARRRAEIDAHFARLQAAKPALWNGRVLLLREWSISRDVLRGTYFETDFASFLAWRDFGFPDMTVCNCFPMAALRAADGAYLLGVMAEHTANAGQIYFPAGTPDPDDIAGDAVNLEGGVVRELVEETGLAASDVGIAPEWTLVQVGPRIALMKTMRSPLPASALREKILSRLATQQHRELDDIRIVRGPADLDARHMPPWITDFLTHAWTALPKPSLPHEVAP